MSESKTEAKVVDLKKRVKAYATANHPCVKDSTHPMKEGDEFTCGEVLLPHLIAKGNATTEKPKASKEAAKA